MSKKLLFLGVLSGILLSFPFISRAQGGFANIDTLLEENALHEAFTRYTSILVFFQPEEATRLGFTSANNRLNDRSLQSDTQIFQALENLRKTVDEINPKNLSKDKQVEYHLLQDTIQRKVWELQQNRLTQDPLYYAQALDAVFDVLQQPASSAQQQRANLLARLGALPTVYEQARKNLSVVSPRLAQRAMEKAYYAYLSFDTLKDYLTDGNEPSNETRDGVQIENILVKAKNTVSDLFELFKNLARQNAGQSPVSSNAKTYAQKLKEYYQFDKKLGNVESILQTRWDEAQHQLFAALRPFELSADEEEMVIVEDLNQRPQEKLQAKSKAATLEYVPPTANQFYAVAGQLVSPFTQENLLGQFTQQANNQELFFLQQKALPGSLPINVQTLLPYFAYQKGFLSYPAFAMFWLRMPSGNELAKTQMLNRDFNEPATKLLISEELIPGRYYQAQTQPNVMRRLFGSPLLANGWALYALRLAQQTNIFVTDEELLFAAWQRFMRTLNALLDYRVNTQQYSYEEALTFLTEQNGFAPETATELLDAVLSNPGDATSYILGETLWQSYADKYAKKTKDDLAVTALLLEMGNVSPRDVNAELKRIYKSK